MLLLYCSCWRWSSSGSHPMRILVEAYPISCEEIFKDTSHQHILGQSWTLQNKIKKKVFLSLQLDWVNEALYHFVRINDYPHSMHRPNSNGIRGGPRRNPEPMEGLQSDKTFPAPLFLLRLFDNKIGTNSNSIIRIGRAGHYEFNWLLTL